MSLNLNNFQTVINDNFADDTALDTSIWTNAWGYANQFSFGNGCLTLSAYEQPYWQGVAIMQRATGPSAGEGYGLYQFTGYANAGQGAGINFIMWRADNQWLDSATPNKATEIDILETWDGTRTAESVVHYYSAGWSGGDGMVIHPFPLDMTKPHTYAMDWERGSLTYYVDGKQIYQDTTHVPLDYADGGCNEVMGAQITGEKALVTTPTVQLHIIDINYSAPKSASSPPPTPTPPASPPNSVTLGGGAQSYSAAAGQTVQAGAGSDTVTAIGGLVSVTGSSGSLTFLGGSGPSTVSGGAGSATLYGGAGGGSYAGGAAGGNLLVAQGGSGANTTLTGAGAGDRLFGSASGNDTLVAGSGSESILGGGSNTSITGGSAADVIFTAGGPSTVQGGVAGGDIIVGGSGSLDVAANNGDAIFGDGATTVTGSAGGADSIVGGTGALSVTGKGANMLVVAGQAQSTISTGSGASLIYAGSGATSVTGGAGGMQVVLGSGKTTANEGSGAAIFDVVNGSAGGSAVLNGFRPGVDTIDLYGYAASDQHVTSSGGSTVLTLSDGTSIQLVGVSNAGGSIVG